MKERKRKEPDKHEGLDRRNNLSSPRDAHAHTLENPLYSLFPPLYRTHAHLSVESYDVERSVEEEK